MCLIPLFIFSQGSIRNGEQVRSSQNIDPDLTKNSPIIFPLQKLELHQFTKEMPHKS
jgi:hypothetical protein